MSHRGPVSVDERHRFDAVIDVRSPAEFADDHLPGAINLPVLDDEERRVIGTLYKQQGAFEARRLGAAMVAANLGRHLRTLGGKPPGWAPLVYCWRGGMRSGSVVTWLRLVGWDAQQLAGGYKRWRQHVMLQTEALVPALQFQVLCGATGSAKTRLLHRLRDLGAQVLDLESLACHKGSLLGNLPGQPQPSQRAFETQLVAALEGFSPDLPVFVESESRKIGRLALPTALVERMRQAPCIEVQASAAARLTFLLRDYAYLGDDRAALARRLDSLRTLHGHAVVSQWQDWARAGDLAPLFQALALQHYDPLYTRSQQQHFQHWADRRVICTDDLSDDALRELARQLWATAPDEGIAS